MACKREVLGVTTGPSEAETFWNDECSFARRYMSLETQERSGLDQAATADSLSVTRASKVGAPTPRRRTLSCSDSGNRSLPVPAPSLKFPAGRELRLAERRRAQNTQTETTRRTLAPLPSQPPSC